MVPVLGSSAKKSCGTGAKIRERWGVDMEGWEKTRPWPGRNRGQVESGDMINAWTQEKIDREGGRKKLAAGGGIGTTARQLKLA